MRVKAFLVHKNNKKFVNVKPVGFLHSARSEMKNQGLCRISDHKKYDHLGFSLARVPPRVLRLPSPGAPASGRAWRGRDPGSTNIDDR